MPSSDPLDTMIETFSMLSSMANSSHVPPVPAPRRGRPGSDAAPRLGDAGHLGGDLGWALREELVELLDADPRGLPQDPDGGPGALLLVLVPHERDDSPVPAGQMIDALGFGDLGRHFLGPLAGVGEKAVLADGHRLAGVGRGWHGDLPVVVSWPAGQPRWWAPACPAVHACPAWASPSRCRGRPGRAGARASRRTGT